MMKCASAGLLVASVIGASVGAQAAPRGSDAVVGRARAMALAGNAAGARALLDSALAALPAGSPEGATLLYARATTEESAAGAERDYQRVVVEYPTAAVAEESTLRLAQLELQRGDNARATARLERLRADQGPGAARGRTSYWVARAYLEGGDTARGCAALAEARAQVDQSDVEVRNQVAYYASRCRDAAPRADSAVTAPAARLPDPNPSHAEVPHVVVSRTPPSRAATPARAARGTSSTATYTVQVAALQDRAAAATVVKRLRAAGFAARVDGTEVPYRVRVGQYPTHAAADAVAKRLRARKSPALVVEVTPR